MGFYNWCIGPYVSLHFMYNTKYKNDIRIDKIYSKPITNNESFLYDNFKKWLDEIKVDPPENIQDYYAILHLFLEGCHEMIIVGRSTINFKDSIKDMYNNLKAKLFDI